MKKCNSLHYFKFGLKWRGHLKNIHLHSCNHKTVKLKLTLTLTLTDTGGAVLALLGYRRLRNYTLKRKIQKLRLRKYRGVYSQYYPNGVI